MTQAIRLVLAIGIGALALQGCATNGVVRSDGSAPRQAIAPAPQMQIPGTAIPEQDGKPVVKADTKENFQAIVAAIHQQMQPGGRWQYIDKQERGTIDGSFADMQRMYDQFGSVDKMDQAARIRLLADQNTVNTILTRKDGYRLICQNEMPVGSHLPVKTCKTYAQIQAERRGAQDFMQRHSETMQQKSGH